MAVTTSTGVIVQVADHVHAHPTWRHVCYNNGQMPSGAPLDTIGRDRANKV